MKFSVIDAFVYVCEKILSPIKAKAITPVKFKGRQAPLYLIILGVYSFFGFIFAMTKFRKVIDSCGDDSYAKGAATFYGYVLGFPILILKSVFLKRTLKSDGPRQ